MSGRRASRDRARRVPKQVPNPNWPAMVENGRYLPSPQNRGAMKPLPDISTLRKPRRMLVDRVYDSHKVDPQRRHSSLGLRTGPIEGPTHFSQFDPLLHHVFGRAWFETGCINAHYRNMVVEGRGSPRLHAAARRRCPLHPHLGRESRRRARIDGDRVGGAGKDESDTTPARFASAWPSCAHRVSWSSTVTCTGRHFGQGRLSK